MDKLYQEGANTYLEVCSESSKHHSEELEEQAQLLPTLVWSSAKIHGEILANTANLNTIASYCRRGKMATEELGESMGNNQLSLLDPEKTEIISIESTPDEDTISFRYYANYDDNTETNWILYIVYYRDRSSIIYHLSNNV